MNVENVKAQMRKGFLEYCVLLVLKNKAAYTSEMIKELKAAKLIVVEGTLYPLLTRLKKEDVLDYRWEESTKGPPRKYYQVTEKGRKILNELNTEWSIIAESIDTIIKTNKIDE